MSELFTKTLLVPVKERESHIQHQQDINGIIFQANGSTLHQNQQLIITYLLIHLTLFLNVVFFQVSQARRATVLLVDLEGEQLKIYLYRDSQRL